MPDLSDDQIRRVVKETLLQLGVDVSDPDSVVAFQRDLHHLRKWRIAVEQVEGRTMLAAFATLGAGIAAAIWIGFKQLVNGGPGG